MSGWRVKVGDGPSKCQRTSLASEGVHFHAGPRGTLDGPFRNGEPTVCATEAAPSKPSSKVKA